jgi:hypothetical protein
LAAKTTRDVAVIIPKGLLERVEDFQFAHRLDSRVEALLQLIEIGLEANSPGSGPHSSPGPQRPASGGPVTVTLGGSSFKALLDVGIVIAAVATIYVVTQLERVRRDFKTAVAELEAMCEARLPSRLAATGRKRHEMRARPRPPLAGEVV